MSSYNLKETLKRVSEGDINYYPHYLDMYQEWMSQGKKFIDSDSGLRRFAYEQLRLSFTQGARECLWGFLPAFDDIQMVALIEELREEYVRRIE